MTSKRSAEIKKQLGMSHGSARNILHKSILFDLVCKSGLNICYQCGSSIEKIDDFSIEHIEPWLHAESANELYFNLDNISYSHLKCNISAARRNPQRSSHGTRNKYNLGCRCDLCVEAQSKYAKCRYSSERRAEKFKRLGT